MWVVIGLTGVNGFLTKLGDSGMFNRKLKERIDRLERMVDGQKDTRGFGMLYGLRCEFGHPALAGLRDKVDAISARLGVEYEKTPDTKGAWVAVDKRKRKARNG